MSIGLAQGGFGGRESGVENERAAEGQRGLGLLADLREGLAELEVGSGGRRCGLEMFFKIRNCRFVLAVGNAVAGIGEKIGSRKTS